ncbi:MAG: hypothetical protein H3C47_02160 [Candidatus Cloacimonetes bacterium]|nr:hypothetical protein [Candidatus Cloacimonadota bacterium]
MEYDLKYVTFPDSVVEQFLFEPEQQRLMIELDEAIYDNDREVRRIPGCRLYVSDWQTIQIRDYKANQSIKSSSPDLYLADLIDVHFDEKMVRLRGLGQGTGEWVDYIFEHANYRLEEKM